MHLLNGRFVASIRGSGMVIRQAREVVRRLRAEGPLAGFLPVADSVCFFLLSLDVELDLEDTARRTRFRTLGCLWVSGSCCP